MAKTIRIKGAAASIFMNSLVNKPVERRGDEYLDRTAVNVHARILSNEMPKANQYMRQLVHDVLTHAAEWQEYITATGLGLKAPEADKGVVRCTDVKVGLSDIKAGSTEGEKPAPVKPSAQCTDVKVGSDGEKSASVKSSRKVSSKSKGIVK